MRLCAPYRGADGRVGLLLLWLSRLHPDFSVLIVPSAHGLRAAMVLQDWSSND